MLIKSCVVMIFMIHFGPSIKRPGFAIAGEGGAHKNPECTSPDHTDRDPDL